MAENYTSNRKVLLEEVIKKKASDLHLQVGLPPMAENCIFLPIQNASVLTEESS